MNKMNWLITACCLALFCSWTQQSGQKIGKAQWLTGTWEHKTTKGSIYENWKKVSDTELYGKSYSVKGKDTIVFETIRLAEEQGQLYYIPSVNNQNEGKPVRFKLTKLTSAQMIFQNSEHDFPQAISYTKKGKDSLVAEISGLRNGRQSRQAFPMKKIK